MKNLLKTLTLCLLASIYLAACDKKEPGPGYYFKFKADGVAYNYEYDRKVGFNGTTSNMGAFQSTTTAWGGTYQIYGYTRETPTARGEVRFYLNKDDFNNLDTIILNRDNNNVVAITDFLRTSSNYEMYDPLNGYLIFTEKTDSYLKGIFVFELYKLDYGEDGGSKTITDTILKITNGEFFVGRSY